MRRVAAGLERAVVYDTAVLSTMITMTDRKVT